MWKSHEIDDYDDIELCAHYFTSRLLEASAAEQIPADALDLIVYDFDGVMTDNRAIVDQTGRESVIVNRSDGLGVKRIRDLGVPQLILSTEANPVVARRAEKLQLEVIQDCADKADALRAYCQRHGHDLQRCVFVGNDTNDLGAMRLVGYPLAPADAHGEVLRLARITLPVNGGAGVIKVLAECLTAEA